MTSGLPLWACSSIPYDGMALKSSHWNAFVAYHQSNLGRILFAQELARRAKINGSRVTSYIIQQELPASDFICGKEQVVHWLIYVYNEMSCFIKFINVFC